VANLEAFQKNIETLRGAIPELRAVLIGSTEGLPVAHWIAGGADPARVAAMADRISAMAAAAMTLGKRVSESQGRGRRAYILRQRLKPPELYSFCRRGSAPAASLCLVSDYQRVSSPIASGYPGRTFVSRLATSDQHSSGQTDVSGFPGRRADGLTGFRFPDRLH
jgi:hypothetical protein